MKHSANTLDYIPGRERRSDDLILPTRLGPKLRGLLITFAMLSLVLFLASAVAWIHSIHRRDMIGWAGWKDQNNGIWQGRGIAATDGAVAVYWFSGTYRFDDPYGVGANATTMQPHFLRLSRPYAVAGVRKFRSVDSHYGWAPLYFRVRFLSIPLWLPTAAFAIAPAVWLIMIARIARRKQRRGFPIGMS